MPDSGRPVKTALLNEAALFLVFFLAGILLLPLAIYVVGQAFFGDYGGTGFADFYSQLHYELRSGQAVSWYLVMSPYLCWQLLRLTIRSFRKSARTAPPAGG